MTVLFCDLKGFTGTSEGMTPQGLVKVMNRYFSTMSAPIRDHEGIIDKYIGDAIMAYWGPPFTDDADAGAARQPRRADMLELVPQLRAELPELLGVRNLPNSFDLRIGIATGEVLVGSIGSELMMSYTVMGDTVNLASRLEGANKEYGGRILVSEATVAGAVGRRRGARDRPRRGAGSKPAAGGVRDHGAQGRIDARAVRAARLTSRKDWPATGATMGRSASAPLRLRSQCVPNDGPSITFIKRLDRLILHSARGRLGRCLAP